MIPDLSPRLEHTLEWWFVQGRFSAPGAPGRGFMVSIFRQAARAGEGDGHMLLLSIHDEAGKTHTFRSRISPRLVENFVKEAPGELKNARIREHLVQAYIDEIARGGPPEPIHVCDQPITLADAGLNVKWGDFALSEEDGVIRLRFRLPDNGSFCTLELTPQARWLREDGNGRFRFKSMAYESCPRLALVGTMDGERFEGDAWMDHQWGDYGWLKSDEENEPLGWVWFGINLDNGTDLIVAKRQNMITGDIVETFIVRFPPDDEPVVSDDIRLTEIRRWESPATFMSFPVEWHIEAPEFGVSLTFEPAIDDQEIPVFGSMTAIWEGVGTVYGTLAGAPVRGRARLELQGYGNILDFETFQHRWIERIDATLEDFLPKLLDEDRLNAYAGPPRWSYDVDAQTEMISRPVWDLISRGGKHWRPVYGLLLLDALGVDIEPYETMISVVPELVHNGSVIIDDIQDQSETRRGDQTIHLSYGLPTAINTGNMLYFLPLLTLADHPALSPPQRDEIYRVMVTTFVQAHIGQAQDLYWSRPAQLRRNGFWQNDRLGDQILQAHAFKTAAAVRAISDIVCIIGETTQPVREISARFAESWGVAFQIVDDVNNFCKEPEWGKVRGEDLAAGKTTYLIYKAIRMLDEPGRAELIDILEDMERRTSADGLNRGIDLIQRSGAPEACREEAKSLVEAEWPQFAETLPQTQSKIMLRLFVANLLNLPFEA